MMIDLIGLCPLPKCLCRVRCHFIKLRLTTMELAAQISHLLHIRVVLLQGPGWQSLSL